MGELHCIIFLFFCMIFLVVNASHNCQVSVCMCCRESQVAFSNPPNVHYLGLVTGGLKQLYFSIAHPCDKAVHCMCCNNFFVVDNDFIESF